MYICVCLLQQAMQVASYLRKQECREDPRAQVQGGTGRTIKSRESFPTLYQLESLPAVPSTTACRRSCSDGAWNYSNRGRAKLLGGSSSTRFRSAQRPRGRTLELVKIACRYGRARSPTTRGAGRTGSSTSKFSAWLAQARSLIFEGTVTNQKSRYKSFLFN
jgi:hypothetical protein